MFGPSRPFYYFSRFEITFDLLFEDEDDLTLIMIRTGLRAVESLLLQSSLQRTQQRRQTANSLGKLKCPSTQHISKQGKLVTVVNFLVPSSIQ